MSYTSFAHQLSAPAGVQARYLEQGSDMTLHTLSKMTATTLSVNTVNTGDREGDEVVMVFAAPPGAGKNGAPLKSLTAFERVSLPAGGSVRTDFAIEAQHLTLAAEDASRSVAKGAWRIWVGVDGEESAVTLRVA